MKKGVFLALLAVYILAFNLLILNSVTSQGITSNLITGEVTRLAPATGANPNVAIPLALFNVAIVVAFSLSFYYHLKGSYHKA